jgi:hypothetical protein
MRAQKERQDVLRIRLLITHSHRNLMAPDEMKNLGFANLNEVVSDPNKTASVGNK